MLVKRACTIPVDNFKTDGERGRFELGAGERLTGNSLPLKRP